MQEKYKLKLAEQENSEKQKKFELQQEELFEIKAKIKQLIDSIIETSHNEYEYSFYFANNQVNIYLLNFFLII